MKRFIGWLILCILVLNVSVCVKSEDEMVRPEINNLAGEPMGLNTLPELNSQDFYDSSNLPKTGFYPFRLHRPVMDLEKMLAQEQIDNMNLGIDPKVPLFPAPIQYYQPPSIDDYKESIPTNSAQESAQEFPYPSTELDIMPNMDMQEVSEVQNPEEMSMNSNMESENSGMMMVMDPEQQVVMEEMQPESVQVGVQMENQEFIDTPEENTAETYTLTPEEESTDGSESPRSKRGIYGPGPGHSSAHSNSQSDSVSVNFGPFGATVSSSQAHSQAQSHGGGGHPIGFGPGYPLQHHGGGFGGAHAGANAGAGSYPGGPAYAHSNAAAFGGGNGHHNYPHHGGGGAYGDQYGHYGRPGYGGGHGGGHHYNRPYGGQGGHYPGGYRPAGGLYGGHHGGGFGGGPGGPGYHHGNNAGFYPAYDTYNGYGRSGIGRSDKGVTASAVAVSPKDSPSPVSSSAAIKFGP